MLSRAVFDPPVHVASALADAFGPELPDWLLDGFRASLASDRHGDLIILECRACLVRYMVRAGARLTAQQRWNMQTHGTGLHGDCP